ncbi:IS3 family transposase [Lacticaseibacillus sharpeae]|uniref:Integrase catalytic region n=1 Tax=Lacticaseibacillus sharpeae JCM 1186 = DSM 20505 TaxID=1291052 RepID=A0A0R1ZIQ6_9LACO|nr:IS3 family transposase [Lacticaseibacillus sharpeae]KRM54881.1 integrase catalytic region [Lacticaseibacillus sharpeae JCM 1186 = DSM 20505]
MTNRDLYAFIKTHDFPIVTATDALSVPRGSYYRYCNHEATPTEKRRAEIKAQLHVAYKASKGRYGAPKLTFMINQQRKDRVGQKLIQKLMREEGLCSITRRKYRATPAANPVAERNNLLAQDFSTTNINQKWAGDITYVKTAKDGWTYLCTFMDLFSRRIVGFAYGRDMTEPLVIKAFSNALINRDVYEGLTVHTDLGSQFTGKDFEEILVSVGAKHSYSRKATPYDNAIIESFHASFKKEEHYVYPENYRTFEQARTNIFEYIEKWYNRTRIHTGLEMMSPVQYELTHLSGQMMAWSALP